jgi:hypothetical protein
VTFRTIETSSQEGFGQIPNERATEHVRAEADHVHVVVSHSLVRGKGVVNQCRPCSFHLVGSDARSHSASADRHSALHLARRHVSSQGHDVIGIIVFQSQTGRAKVNDLVSRLTQRLVNCFFKANPA